MIVDQKFRLSVLPYPLNTSAQVSLNYLGPLSVKNDSGVIALFTCFTIRAVHLEVYLEKIFNRYYSLAWTSRTNAKRQCDLILLDFRHVKEC